MKEDAGTLAKRARPFGRFSVRIKPFFRQRDETRTANNDLGLLSILLVRIPYRFPLHGLSDVIRRFVDAVLYNGIPPLMELIEEANHSAGFGNGSQRPVATTAVSVAVQGVVCLLF